MIRPHPRPRPRARFLAAAVLAAACLALVACGRSDPAPPATTAVPAATTPIVTTAPATPVATAATTAPMPTAPASPVPTAATATPIPTTTATPAPVAVVTATPVPGGMRGLEVSAEEPDPKGPPAPDTGARQAGGIEPGAGADKPPAEPGDGDAAGRSEAPSGPVYTWREGEHTRLALLQPGLTAGADGQVSADGADGGQPVFRSESGALMTLPGGVLLVLDPEWTEEQVQSFLERNAIAGSLVSDLGWLPNGFFLETASGFPSLHLANALAGQEGVVLSAPNWLRETETR